MNIVTMKQALRKARKIWGKNAHVKDNGQPLILANGAKLGGQYSVGKIMIGMFFSVEGDGDSWGDEAFEDFETKQAREKNRMASLLKSQSPSQRIRGTVQGGGVRGEVLARGTRPRKAL